MNKGRKEGRKEFKEGILFIALTALFNISLDVK